MVSVFLEILGVIDLQAGFVPELSRKRKRYVIDLKLDWNKVFELTWRALVFIVALAIIAIVSTNWNRWEGGEGWQTANDAYLEADLTRSLPRSLATYGRCRFSIRRRLGA